MSVLSFHVKSVFLHKLEQNHLTSQGFQAIGHVSLLIFLH